MKEIARIIEEAGKAKEFEYHIKIENGSYMDLVIEGIGMSPDGRKMVSVAHYGKQNGDLMRDPEMVFLVDENMAGKMAPAGFADGWYPISMTQDYMGYYQEAIRWEPNGQMLKSHAAMKDQKTFARIWNKNIRIQGFLKAYRASKQPMLKEA